MVVPDDDLRGGSTEPLTALTAATAEHPVGPSAADLDAEPRTDLAPRPDPVPRPDPDTDDIVARMRSGALSAAATAYTAAHGHPLEHPDPLIDPPSRRWALTRRSAVVVGLVLLAVAIVVVLRAWAAAPPDVVPFGAPGATGQAGDGATAADPFRGDPFGEDSLGAGAGAEADGSRIVVHVVGEVVAPGVVELGPGARVAEAVAAAGGATAEANLGALNLARHVEDGEQVVVPGVGGPEDADDGAGEGEVVAADPRIDLNAADAAQLETLPGIGPVLAARIVAWREEHGRFTSVAELTEISGIGPRLFAQLESLVRV